MTTISLPVQTAPPRVNAPLCIALAGNPNAGKTSLFNRLTGLRAKTANFPGTTIERRCGRATFAGVPVEILDLPGLYGLSAATSEERIARDSILGQVPGQAKPAAVVLILDATNLERNLYLASQVLELGIPCIAAINMIDLARREGIRIDIEALRRDLGCPVVPICARSGEGIAELRHEIGRLVEDSGLESSNAWPLPEGLLACGSCGGCPHRARYDWAEQVGGRCVSGQMAARGGRTEAIDRFLTHPVVGVAAFFAVMLTIFYMIFSLAAVPMDLIDGFFGSMKAVVGSWLPAGDFRSLVTDGVISGVGSVLVFLPQICILFFFIALLEDSGYLARAAFVMDRLMRRVGLPGKAFVPMLSAHACAIPAIMASRVIEDRRDRLVTILVLPLFTCSARLPVYAMVTALLFRDNPLMGAVVFTGAYFLGVVAALGMAFVFKRTILPGETKPLVLELPGYKLPNLRNALYEAVNRGRLFVRKAGTVILLICIGLWALTTYPKSEPPAEAVALYAQAADLQAAGDASAADDLLAQADHLTTRHASEHSLAGMIGRNILEPVMKPLGFDWRISVGVLSSFAAREVIVSSLGVIFGLGDEVAQDDPGLLGTLSTATWPDGAPLFTTATCLSLLVFFVLAMQCLPTQVVTRRETGSWTWAGLQLGYMTILAYTAAFVVYQIASAVGG